MRKLASIVLLTAVLVACGSTSSSTGAGAVTASSTSSSAASSGTSGGGGSAGSGGAAATTIQGSVDGHDFNVAGSALVIGASDDPMNTTVVYVFSAPVACADISKAGWDTTISDGTNVLEMKEIGTTPATYKVTSSPSPAMGEAAVNYTLSSQSGTPVETQSKSGAVTLETLTAMGPATGTFDLTFANGSLKGTFAAAWCAIGREP